LDAVESLENVLTADNNVITGFEGVNVNEVINSVVTSSEFITALAGEVSARAELDNVELALEIKDGLGGVVKVDNTIYDAENQNIYVPRGSTVTLLAMPLAGYTFVDWSGDLVSNTASETLLMDTNKAIKATFSV